MDAEDNLSTPDNSSDQSASVRIDSPISSSRTSDSETPSISRGAKSSIVPYVGPPRRNADVVVSNSETPLIRLPLGQPYYYKGYYIAGQWGGGYQAFVNNTQGVDMISQGIYHENPLHMVQAGFGYVPFYYTQQYLLDDFSLAPGAFPRASTPPPDFNTFPSNNVQPGFDGFGFPHPSPDFTRHADRPELPHVPSQPISTYGSFSNFSTALQQQQPFTFGTAANCFNKNCQHCSNNDHKQECSSSNCKGCQRFENNRRNGCPLHTRGPRALRPKNQNICIDITFGGMYNNPDFVTDYAKAKFFIIKSYSEYDIHQSIKYRVWTSTGNGNRKLNDAYNCAKQTGDNTPVFLFFSVNCSGQFCGVAEMIGPVDFQRSFSFWLHQKWSGHFRVNWYLLKDVPNSRFRHIILENNENRPVTTGRDTHELEKVEQGVEMLRLFKSYEYKMSILEDYCYYEGRSRQQVGSSPGLPADALQIISRSFADSVALNGAPPVDPRECPNLPPVV